MSPGFAKKLRAIAVLLPALACHAGFAPAAEEVAAPAASTLNSLFLSYSRDTAPYFPFAASDAGNRAYDGVLANYISADYRAGLTALCGDYLRRLREINVTTLNDQQRLSYEMFEYMLSDCLTDYDHPWYLTPVDQAGFSLPSRFAVIGAGNGNHPFKTVANYEDFLKRVDGFVAWVDTAIANMRIGARYGWTQPRVLMAKLIPQLEAHIVDDPRTSVFFDPIRKMPPEFDAGAREQLAAQYLSAIEQKILPAYLRLRDFIRDEYMPRCRTTDGMVGLPGGRARYLQEVRYATTTDLTPEEIFALGRSEVARIEREIAALQAEIGAGQVPALTRYDNADDLLKGYEDLRVAVTAALPRLFGRLPTFGYELRTIEAAREKSMSSSYMFGSLDGSRPGVFYLNAADLKSSGGATVSRALFLHEAVPGHHLQVSLQRENAQLPSFRRTGWYNAFGEGWALYAERLGRDLGVYANPRDRLAMLQLEIYRAARLVVDVGLHEKGWTRRQAMNYLIDTAGDTPENAEREVERYMAWPGQALGYKIGELKILEIRRKAVERLGASFDIRDFHDELLKDGAMPLSILERKMDRWIAARAGKDPK